MTEEKSLTFEEFKEAFFLQHNKLRTDPQSFIPILEEQASWFKDNILSRPGEIPIQTTEGKDAFLLAIEFLRHQKPVQALKYDENLSKAAEDHAKDIGPKGLITHDSSDGKNVSDRVEKYCEWDSACGENIDIGSKNPLDVLVNLLVDDGVEKRPHRAHLFNEKFNFMGVGIAEHKDFDVIVVVDYTGGVRPLGTPHFDFNNFKYQFPEKDEKKEKKPKTSFQLEDPDAPDTTMSVKIQKATKLYNGRLHKITKKFYTLQDGTTHIVEVEDI